MFSDYNVVCISASCSTHQFRLDFENLITTKQTTPYPQLTLNMLSINVLHGNTLQQLCQRSQKRLRQPRTEKKAFDILWVTGNYMWKTKQITLQLLNATAEGDRGSKIFKYNPGQYFILNNAVRQKPGITECIPSSAQLCSLASERTKQRDKLSNTKVGDNQYKLLMTNINYSAC
jgi:hypothetical protein